MRYLALSASFAHFRPNWQRPHQGISCGNRPPRVAFPHLPALPPVPDLVNPDAWLSQVKGQHLVRRVNRQGFVKVDLYPYYISSKQAFQRVTLSIQATEQSLQLVYPQEYRRSLPRVWLTAAGSALSGVPSTHAARSLDSTAFAYFREVESPLRLIASST
jgi:hypothetical protein